ncbi:sugar phosphate permease [Panacagrimonas perspica]|uniref:Sugar phosphate permease n=1 Tax=Panacagrimonas perspica TaxID=381431 RepID=A0A4R7P0G6_9GAMM|nr:MFS transporter [Panacagrimonas perspica]TDU26541.1 sugar phosphate permease [Panacagrimonas perspica]THD03911.1 MFS transporter [Panacagrimonas perspica]
MTEPVPRHDAFAALRIPNFRNLMGGTFLITCGLQMQRVALGYTLYLLTRDPLSLGLLGLAEAIPFMGLALFGGHMADRRDKRRMMQVAGAVFMSGTLLLFFASLMRSHVSDALLAGLIYVVVFIEGLARGLYSPASSSLKPFLVPREHYGNSATWSSMSWQAGAILGPALGGFVFAAIGLPGTLAVVVGLIVINILLTGAIDPPAAAKQVASKDPLWRSLGEGLAYVWRTPIILYSISLDMFSVLFGGVMAILPIFAEDILRVGPEGMGILRAAPAVGAVGTMLICAWWPPTRHAWRNLLWSVLGFGVATLVFGLSTNFWISMVALAASGAFDSVSVVIRGTIVQSLTEDHMRGRVAAVNSVFVSASNELGAFESGVAAKLLGVVPSVVFGAAATFATVAYIWRRSRTLFAVRL